MTSPQQIRDDQTRTIRDAAIRECIGALQSHGPVSGALFGDARKRLEALLSPDQGEEKWSHRRFGSDHAKPCKLSGMVTCANSECQKADACQADDATVSEMEMIGLQVDPRGIDAGTGETRSGSIPAGDESPSACGAPETIDQLLTLFRKQDWSLRDIPTTDTEAQRFITWLGEGK